MKICENQNHGYPYSLEKKQKDRLLTEQLKELTAFHADHCPEYANMLSALGCSIENINDYRDVPFIPVGLFKKMRLSSAEDSCDNTNIKTLTSSGTTGQTRSTVILDGETRTAQQKALSEIGMDFLGPYRMPMLVIDCPSTVKNRGAFSARAAGILGFSLFGSRRTYALNDDMTINIEAVSEFLEQYENSKFLMFGFTFMIWQFLCEPFKDGGERPDLSHGIMIHGGGWKKLQDLDISSEEFKSVLQERFGINEVHDYYGMAEQAGSIFMECECGVLHASDYSEVLIRNAEDFSLCENGEAGIIQVLSTLPKSYPGHSLLTEDKGVILGEDDCPCGRKGAYFKVLGRIKHAEIRGCSDTYENQ